MPPTANFANRTIWTGDNLEIMRGLNSASVDLIYLDPPFNSNRDYEAPVGSQAAGAAFKDTWTLSDLDVAWMGLIADEQPAIYQLLLAAGLTHGKSMQSYLCMMAVRLLEMRRLLKPTGSLYLHCDPTASHYLKHLLDAVFGAHNFRNEIVWKRRRGMHNAGRRFGSVVDIIYYYCKSSDFVFNKQYGEYDPEYIKKFFVHQDEDGRLYQLQNLINPSDRPNLKYDYKGYPHPDKGWAVSLERMKQMDAEGRLHFPENPQGRIRRKDFLDEMRGQPITSAWDDIPMALGKERTGYPTQKPLALLERIIAASSNEGDFVLDPFCGCATACVAAEQLGRQWLGIDLSAKAVELVNLRLRDFMGDLFHSRLVTAREDIPQRTDVDAPRPYRQNRHVLFGQQEGRCRGCQTEFPFKLLEVDHIIPRSRGGTDHLENLQLLCAHCNRIKGDRPQEYLVARLQELSG